MKFRTQINGVYIDEFLQNMPCLKPYNGTNKNDLELAEKNIGSNESYIIDRIVKVFGSKSLTEIEEIFKTIYKQKSNLLEQRYFFNYLIK